MRKVVPWVLAGVGWLPGLPAPAGEPAWVSLWAAEVPAATVMAWRGKPAAEWFEAARAEVAAGRAGEAGVLMLSGTVGGKMVIESLREATYPTEYDPEDWKWRSTTVGLNESLLSERLEVNPPFLYPVPIWTGLSFETRNVGETIEAEVSGGDFGGVLKLRLAADWVRQEGEDVYLEWAQDDGGKWKLAYPRFATRRFCVQIDCPAGRWVLAGMVDPWREEAGPGRKALVFVRVEAELRPE